MYKIIRHKSFKKDITKIKMTDEQFAKFIVYCGKLIENKQLPKEALDHSLKGNLKKYREFHLGGDLVVLYKKDEKEKAVILIGIGSHNQIFQKNY